MKKKTASQKKAERKKQFNNKPFYNVRSLFGYNDTYFYILLGGRDYGKSYSVMDYFLRDYKRNGKPFYWLRLTDDAANGLLQNNAAKLVDADLRRKYDLELDVKGWEVFDHGNKMAEVQGLSTFYSKKGTASFDCDWKKGYNIMVDEAVREIGEKNTFDINYALVNMLENYVRDTKEKLKIVFACNYTQNCPDLLNLFNFIPEKFGRYHLAAKKAVLDYLPDTPRYRARRKGTVSDILMGEASTFTNKTVLDKSLLTSSRKVKPISRLKFREDSFLVWQTQDGGTVISGDNPNIKMPNNTYALESFVDGLGFDPFYQKNYRTAWDKRRLRFDCLITQQRFKQALINSKKK